MNANLDSFYRENEKLIHHASRKALARFAKAGLSGHVEYDDIFGTLTEVFIRCYGLVNLNKAKFSTYFMTASFNRVTNMINYMFNHVEIRTDSVYEISQSSDDESFEPFEVFFSYTPDFEQTLELDDELRAIREKLSPFAKILLDYTLNPPEFIEREYMAQRANVQFASDLGYKRATSHSRNLNLQFVANCLRSTTSNPQELSFIRKAVDELRHAIKHHFPTE
ncbi:hypothetical protein [Acinetobacter brisouii]|uniref:hypothetical protein n=1 Tax=Acinetobacter brisouii TaxID=396323 RepID=UPI00124DB0F1|nr:hypothetical protein [Acinetobacter brisouii]